MLLYKTTYTDPKPEMDDLATVVIWGGSLTEASKARSGAKSRGFKPETQTVEVPTNKAGLLEWLNANVTA